MFHDIGMDFLGSGLTLQFVKDSVEVAPAKSEEECGQDDLRNQPVRLILRFLNPYSSLGTPGMCMYVVYIYVTVTSIV